MDDTVSDLLTNEHPALQFFSARFLGEWDGAVDIPYLDTLLGPTEMLNIKHILPLATDTPYGNLQTSWITLLNDISVINELIQKTNQDHASLRAHLQAPPEIMEQGLLTRQRANAEGLCQLIKTLIDRLIMLTAVVTFEKANGTYPDKITPSSIGEFLNTKEGEFCDGALDTYRPILTRINTVANALKHTFLNLQSSSIINSQTPGITVFYQHKNDSKKGQRLDYLIFSNLVKETNQFAVEVKGLLRA